MNVEGQSCQHKIGSVTLGLELIKALCIKSHYVYHYSKEFNMDAFYDIKRECGIKLRK